MSEGMEAKEELMSRAAGIIAAAKGAIKIRQAMKLVGFSHEEICNMTLYQRVRRQSTRLSVVDTRVVAMKVDDVSKPVSQVNINSGDTVTSTLSSAERTGDTLRTGTGDPLQRTDDGDPRVVATPRRLEKRPAGDGTSVTSKKSRRSSKEVHRVQAHFIMQTKKESTALKLATSRIAASNELPIGHPDKKSINTIVKEVNDLCDSNVSPKTAGTYVKKGRINTSPLKRGPIGSFPKPTLDSLKWAYASFIQLEQAEATTQSSIKEMSKRVNACVNYGGFHKCRDDLTRKLRNQTADLFTVGKSNVIEHRRLQWTTHQNLDMWFTTWKGTLIELGFGREALPTDEVDGEIFFYPDQTRRIINVDETDGSLDNTTGSKGGRPPVVFSDPTIARGATAANKSGYSSTVICGSSAAGEAIPPHFQLKTLAQSDATMKISVDWFLHAASVHGKFGLPTVQELPTTFGMNERGGMNSIELDKYIKKAILPLFPDVEDNPGKRVLLKLDSGPGRMNLDMLADLRLQGVYVIPGVPNTTHVTQETDQNYGLYKSIYRENLETLSEARQRIRKRIFVSDLPLLVFGGYDYLTKATLKNAFERAFSVSMVLSCWKKCGAVPLTRLPLQSKDVRHRLAVDGSPQTQEAERLKEIQALNEFHCNFLTAQGFMGSALRKMAPRLRKTPPAVTVPQSRERIIAIKNAKAAGQMFFATGGQHLNSDEFFQAREHAKRLDEAKSFQDQKEKRLLVQQTGIKAHELLNRKGSLNDKTYKAYTKPEIKLLCKWKGIKILKDDDKKQNLYDLYLSHPNPQASQPWSAEDEAELQTLLKPDMPIEQTHLGVAARQMAVATANNIEKLDQNTRHQLLQSIAAFDRANPDAS